MPYKRSYDTFLLMLYTNKYKITIINNVVLIFYFPPMERQLSLNKSSMSIITNLKCIQYMLDSFSQVHFPMDMTLRFMLKKIKYKQITNILEFVFLIPFFNYCIGFYF
ncbi:hypothetical protein H311_02185 [Anncaliia algerae PRA109]|nr:hypothetical protein H311_02185 [Anncaliia algerae PRA109]